MEQKPNKPNKPNILFIYVDQMRMPPSQENLTPELKLLNQVLAFDPAMKDDNPFLRFFPAFKRLREHGVRLARHQIASAACVPSRASLITGQYPSRHLVTQTAGMFKNDDDPAFPWLPNNQVPTLGDWFRAAGYTTHYFGRHDYTTPPAPSLEAWGFSDWSTSWPSSQGGGAGNLGVFRDIGFVDVVNQFLNRKALGYETNVRNLYNSTNATQEEQPWLAVLGFVNPHDITGWPLPWLGGIQPLPAIADARDADNIFEHIGALLGLPARIPTQGEKGNAPPGGTYQVELNPHGFPQENSVLAPSWDADLRTKPSCQYEASFKISQGFLAQWPEQLRGSAPLPYKSAPRAREWLLAHLQVYIYYHYLVNLELEKVLANLDRNGLWDDTIVVFSSDHGELGGAHGGQIEKWHNAYREAIHVPFVVSGRRVNHRKDVMRDIDFVTSHVDVAPTLLGLAGYGKATQDTLKSLILGHQVYDLVGRDLSAVIQGKESLAPGDAKGVLFVTEDEITLPTSLDDPPATFDIFLGIVKQAIADGKQSTTEGPICQPNTVYAYCEKAWKLARYIDPTSDPNVKVPDQWELYYLVEDEAEDINLVSWSNGEPVPEPDRIPKGWHLSSKDLVSALDRLRKALAAAMLEAGYAPNGGPQSSDKTKPGALQQLLRHHFNAP